MKTFIIKTSTFTLLFAAGIYLYILLLADNETDGYYGRFTTPAYSSLILGSSRAGQGIEPDILNAHLGLKNDAFFNYSFTVFKSAFGDPYLEAIKRKLKDPVDAGFFILELNPWSFFY